MKTLEIRLSIIESKIDEIYEGERSYSERQSLMEKAHRLECDIKKSHRNQIRDEYINKAL